MGYYVWCITAEEDEAALATNLSHNLGATTLRNTQRGRRDALANMANGDVLVIVAHGGEGMIGTSHGAVSITVSDMVTLLGEMGLPKACTGKIVIAACDTEGYARSLEGELSGKGYKVTVKGQSGKFLLKSDAIF